MRFRELKLRKNPDCVVCGPNPTVTRLIDYEAFCGIGPQAAASTGGGVPEISVEELKPRCAIAATTSSSSTCASRTRSRSARFPAPSRSRSARCPQSLHRLSTADDIVVHCRSAREAPRPSGSCRRRASRKVAQPSRRHHRVGGANRSDDAQILTCPRLYSRLISAPNAYPRVSPARDAAERPPRVAQGADRSPDPDSRARSERSGLLVFATSSRCDSRRRQGSRRRGISFPMPGPVPQIDVVQLKQSWIAARSLCSSTSASRTSTRSRTFRARSRCRSSAAEEPREGPAGPRPRRLLPVGQPQRQRRAVPCGRWDTKRRSISPVASTRGRSGSTRLCESTEEATMRRVGMVLLVIGMAGFLLASSKRGGYDCGRGGAQVDLLELRAIARRTAGRTRAGCSWARRDRRRLRPAAREEELTPRNGRDAAARGPASPSRLTADDLYLFHEGSHLSLHDKLGRTRDGRRRAGASFAVWAPRGRGRLVMGEFNGWSKESHPSRLSESGVWEGFVPGIGKGAPYKYHVVSRHARLPRGQGRPLRLFPRSAAAHGLGRLGSRLRVGRRRMDGRARRAKLAGRADRDLRGARGLLEARGGREGLPVARISRARARARRLRPRDGLHARRAPAGHGASVLRVPGDTRRPAISRRRRGTALRRT